MAKVVVVKSAGIGELEQVVAGHRTGQCGVWLIEVEVEAIAVLVCQRLTRQKCLQS